MLKAHANLFKPEDYNETQIDDESKQYESEKDENPFI